MKLSGQKFSAICRKYNLPKYETTGFSFNFYAQEISYNHGRNRKSLQQEVELFILMANALKNEGFDVYYGQQSYSLSPRLNFELLGNVLQYVNEEDFREAFADAIDKDNFRRMEEENRQNQIVTERNRIWNEKVRIAKELNPDIQIDILETIDENHYICYTRMNTQKNFVYIQFAAERKQYWQDESLKWYLKLQPIQFYNDRFDSGSTNVDNCDTIEDGLIDYIATWHIYLDE